MLKLSLWYGVCLEQIVSIKSGIEHNHHKVSKVKWIYQPQNYKPGSFNFTIGKVDLCES